LRAAAAAAQADARDRVTAAEAARDDADRRAAQAADTASQEADARRAAEGGLRATLQRVESESALRARADAEAGRLRTELETLRAELAAARLRSLPPDELRALLVDALAARPDGTPSSSPR
jgi:hypothetical protein